ncbi:MAG: peptide ABC transporter substrate-binding protein [Chloroflexi bacterium]|nr:peptide ABC transporter substrate-binding protein [Chloroflexota bacterium]MCC6892747.1 peptide ABC transporter substrate-binding protein [Anaerolineae bacterium]
MYRKLSVGLLVMSAVLLMAVVSVPFAVAQDANQDVYGRDLPADAAPYDKQIFAGLCNSVVKEISLTSVASVYSRICQGTPVVDQYGDPLVVLDENLQLIPAAAESWEAAADGLSWSFHLRPDQVWSDGTPLTANDYVASYRYMVDPANAYDFVWMWQGTILNWSEAVAGEVPPEEIGVVATDDNTVTIFTNGPRPYLPGTVYFWAPIQAAALAEHGIGYINDPATHVSSGPFILREFTPGESIRIEANPTYNGFRKPYLKEIRGTYGDQLNGSFLAFQNGDIDQVNYGVLQVADFEVIKNDPVLSANYRPNFGDFRTDYLLFDTYTAPFNDVKVRMAFAKALDRESIVKNVVGEQFGIPAYSFLAPGFPASDSEGALKDIQAYDCDAAKALLAEAGYPNGEGFPAQELKLRGENEAHVAWGVAAAGSISQCLGVEITVNNMESATYMEGLLARPSTIQFGMISYGMDYLDPSNMLGVWLSQGRHSWLNAEFDQLVNDAGVKVDDAEARIQMYKDAEKLLVEDVGGVFFVHRIQGDLFQPFIAGDCFRPDAQGVGAFHWGNDWCWGTLYVTNEVDNYDTFRDN